MDRAQFDSMGAEAFKEWLAAAVTRNNGVAVICAHKSAGDRTRANSPQEWRAPNGEYCCIPCFVVRETTLDAFLGFGWPMPLSPEVDLSQSRFFELGFD